MGSPRRQRKQFEIPKRKWDATRIKEERRLVTDYGLKNMHELWRMKTVLRKIRREARRLQSGKGKKIAERTEALLKRVKSFLISEPKSIDDMLALETRDLLERRLETRVVRSGLCSTMLQARQVITHGHIAIRGQRINAPSYLVKFSEDGELGWFKQPIQVNPKPQPISSTSAPKFQSSQPEVTELTQQVQPAGETS